MLYPARGGRALGRPIVCLHARRPGLPGGDTLCASAMRHASFCSDVWSESGSELRLTSTQRKADRALLLTMRTGWQLGRPSERALECTISRRDGRAGVLLPQEGGSVSLEERALLCARSPSLSPPLDAPPSPPLSSARFAHSHLDSLCSNPSLVRGRPVHLCLLLPAQQALEGSTVTCGGGGSKGRQVESTGSALGRTGCWWLARRSVSPQPPASLLIKEGSPCFPLSLPPNHHLPSCSTARCRPPTGHARAILMAATGTSTGSGGPGCGHPPLTVSQPGPPSARQAVAREPCPRKPAVCGRSLVLLSPRSASLTDSSTCQKARHDDADYRPLDSDRVSRSREAGAESSCRRVGFVTPADCAFLLLPRSILLFSSAQASSSARSVLPCQDLESNRPDPRDLLS